jgi:hypothetical protein
MKLHCNAKGSESAIRPDLCGRIITSMLLFLPLLCVCLVILPLSLLYRFRRAVCYKLAGLVDARPFWLPVINIKYPPWIEHVASIKIRLSVPKKWESCTCRQKHGTVLGNGIRGLKILFVCVIFKIDQSGKKQNHISPLIHYGCAAIRAADFAGQLVHTCFLR